jgi:hypothetical protein
MIPVYRWDVRGVSLWSLKFLKCCYPFQFLKRIKFAAGHFHITTQLLSVRSDDSIIYSTTSPLHRFYGTMLIRGVVAMGTGWNGKLLRDQNA